MAKKGNQTINLTKDDFKRKSFKTVPGGTYFVKITPKSALKEMKGGTGINIAAIVTKGKDKSHRGVTFFDNIGPDVKWKIAQLVSGLGITKTKFTMAELLKLIKGGELRAILREKSFEGKKRNEVVQWLPLTVTKDEPKAATDDDEDEEDEEDETEDTDDDESDEDEDGEEDDSDEEDDEEESDDDDEDEDEEEDDEDDSDDEDDDDAEEDEDEDDSDADDEEEEDEEEADEDEDEEEEPAPRPVVKKTAAKKAAPAAKKAAKGKKK